jgi:hypothetical protein
LGGSQNATLNGEVKRDIVAGSQNLIINGTVGRNVNGGTESFTIGATGNIGGKVEYMSDAELSQADGAKISGIITRTAPPEYKESAKESPAAFSLGWFIYVIISMMILGLVLAGLFPRTLNEAKTKALKSPAKTALIGLAAIIFVPVFVIMLIISTIGAPLAIAITLAWILIILLSGPFAGYAIGQLIMRNSKQPFFIMAAGFGLLIVLYFIPIIGFITGLAAWIFGTGMILVQSKKLLSHTSAK